MISNGLNASPRVEVVGTAFNAKDARVKVEVGLCKGKKNYDKRDAAAQRDAKRTIDRAMKSYR